MPLTKRLERRWYAAAPPPLLLRPLAALYGAIADQRRRRAVPQRLSVPVVVVGNISVGGTGKTPVVIWLVEALRQQGWRPGVISRGYGGDGHRHPCPVQPDSDAAEVGDEPLLIHVRTGVPVMVGADRVAAAQALVATGDVDILVADDGLQHYRLGRDIELCVVDGVRGLGNGARLPAGPLREPPTRLADVSHVLVNGGDWSPPGTPPWTRFTLQPGAPRHLAAMAAAEPLAAWAGRRVHAVAGIGRPARFFDTLEAAGMTVVPHPFPDHHAFVPDDLPPADPHCPVLMTEKDAVKCRHFGHAQLFALPVHVAMPETALATVFKTLKESADAR